MAIHVCPWWAGYFIDNPLRRMLHSAEAILGRYVRPGMTVMDLGCGMGLFSIAMARMVGDQGCVIAVDIQQRMLDVLQRRAEKSGVASRIRIHRAAPDRLGVDGTVDFALAFAVMHEVPDAERFLAQVCSCLKSDARFLVAEPRLHVSTAAFQGMLTLARAVGLGVLEEPHVRLSHAVVLGRQ
jgi:ubiquinone/menaquinone biosynthesis C-methylase UbiE